MTLSNCEQCQFYTKPIHPGDMACAINPGFEQMWRQLHTLPTASIAAMPIETTCRSFDEKLPYDLNDRCIRQSSDGMWNLMNHIAQGWGSTCHWYASLAELLLKAQVSITGAYADSTGMFFTIAPNAVSPRSNRSPTTPISLVSVRSSNVAAIGYDTGTRILQVNFHNGTNYHYFGVPQATFDDFLSAHSKGQFLNLYVKPAFTYSRLN